MTSFAIKVRNKDASNKYNDNRSDYRDAVQRRRAKFPFDMFYHPNLVTKLTLSIEAKV